MRIERAIRPASWVVDIEFETPLRPVLPRNERRDAEIFFRQDGEIVDRAGTTEPMMTWSISPLSKPRTSASWSSHTAYSSPVRRGSVAIRQRAFISRPVDQREDDIGISDIGGEQHGLALSFASITSPAWMARVDPSANRSESAPSAPSSSKVPSIRSSPGGCTVSGVPNGWATLSQRRMSGSSP